MDILRCNACKIKCRISRVNDLPSSLTFLTRSPVEDGGRRSDIRNSDVLHYEAGRHFTINMVNLHLRVEVTLHSRIGTILIHRVTGYTRLTIPRARSIRTCYSLLEANQEVTALVLERFIQGNFHLLVCKFEMLRVHYFMHVRPCNHCRKNRVIRFSYVYIKLSTFPSCRSRAGEECQFGDRIPLDSSNLFLRNDELAISSHICVVSVERNIATGSCTIVDDDSVHRCEGDHIRPLTLFRLTTDCFYASVIGRIRDETGEAESRLGYIRCDSVCKLRIHTILYLPSGSSTGCPFEGSDSPITLRQNSLQAIRLEAVRNRVNHDVVNMNTLVGRSRCIHLDSDILRSAFVCIE